MLSAVLAATAASAAAVPAARASARHRLAGTPYPGQLNAVTATSASNAWAVGYSPGETLIERWNGKAWKFVNSLNLGASGDLYGVTATSATSAWAVGYADTESTLSTLILRWNGKSWTRVPSPTPGPEGSFLYGVSASSPTSAWAVGYSAVYSEGWKSLIEHWNGKTWKQVPSPNPFCSTCDSLIGVTGQPAGHAWAVGTVNVGGEVAILRWNGAAWKNSPSASLP
jgi:hypothetical protein